MSQIENRHIFTATALKYFPKADEKFLSDKREELMKFFSNLRNKMRANLLKNNRGQGATEYILLLVVVVGLVMVFKDKIKKTMDSKLNDLQGNIENVKPD